MTIDQTDLGTTIKEMESARQAKLLPILAGPSAGRGAAMLDLAAHAPLVPGKVHVLLAFTGMTPHGTIGMDWLTGHLYQQLGEPPFADLTALAGANLSDDLRMDGYETENGVVLAMKRDGYLAGSALALPGFHERVSSILEAERLIVGIPCPDDLLVTDADGGCADELRSMTLDTDYDQGFLGPTVLLVDRTGMHVVADRQI